MSYARSAVTRMTLDISRPDLQRSETVTQGDTNRRWEVTLINGGAPFRLPPNWTAALTGTKPDGNGLLNGCSVVDGKIVYDFAAGEEIATCVGSYPVQFDVWDEVGELVASPKVYVNVLADVRPREGMKSESEYGLLGEFIAQKNDLNDAIKSNTEQIGGLSERMTQTENTAQNQGDDITALKEKVTTAGTVTIYTTQWSYTTPHTAYMGFPSNTVKKGQAVLFIPLSDATKEAAAKARLSVGVDEVTDGGGDFTDYVLFVQAEKGAVPTVDLDLGYIVLHTAGDLDAMVALIGVDAYDENRGTASGVDESAVKKIINSMLGNVDNVRQYSADNPPPYPVTSVNGKEGAVNLNAEDVGARSSTWMPTAEDVGARPNTWTPTAVDVGADSEGTAAEEVKDHNKDSDSHADIRTMLEGVIGTDTGKSMRAVAALVLAEIVGDASDSFDTLEEIAAWIEAHPNDVAAMVKRITDLETAMGGKVSKTDIINTLDSAALDKPLSAAMGKQLAGAISQINETLAGKTNVQQVSDAITAALKEYLTTAKAAELYQPKGNYLTSSDIPTIPDKLPNPKALTINGKTYDGSKEVSVTVDGSGEEIPTIVLPSKLYGVVGHEYVLYYRNILQAMRPDDFVVSAIISNSAITDLKPLYRDKIMFTPTEALVGQHTITIIVKSRRTWNDVAQKSVTLVISAERAFEGKRVMFVGDSLTFAAVYAKEVQDLSNGGIVSVGTVTAKSVPTEGRNGAASYDYLVKDTIQGAHNPFYNPNKTYTLELDDKYIVNGQDGVSSKIPMDNSGDKTTIAHHFDFEYYMSNHGSTVGDLDAVFINLGNNGGIRSSYKTVHMGFLAMVDRIRAYDPDLPIFLHLFIPKSEAGSIERNFSGQFDGLLNDRTWYYKIVQFYIDKWDNDPRVNLVPTYTMVDTYHDFKMQTVPVSARNPIEVTIGDNDGVHPATPGYDHMADSYYNSLLAYWSGEPIDTYYTVTNHLNHVTNSNTTTSVKAGNSYTATLTAASGYTLDTVTVTMGGTAVSVSGGTINIASVTGDIVITATAIKDEEPEEPTVVNLVDPSTANDASPNTALDADEWVNGYTITGSNTTLAITQADGRFVSDKFPISDNAKVRIKGMDMSSSKRASNKLLIIMSDGKIFRGMAMPIGESGASSVDQDLVNSEGTMLVTVGAFGQAASWPGKAYARICGYPKNGNNANVIVTVE